jgi:disulfide oxidoreductase YuzD
MKPLSPTKLRALWLRLTRTYFPRWRNAARWRVRLRLDRPWTDSSGRVHSKDEAGYCDQKKREISINASCVHEIRSILLHEAVHAVVCEYHAIRFCQRMLRLGNRAEKLEDGELARELREDVRRYPLWMAADELLRNGIIKR